MPFMLIKRAATVCLILILFFIVALPTGRSFLFALVDNTGVFYIGRPLQAELMNDSPFTYPLKTWKIKFNQPISPETMNDQFISIKSADDQTINTKVTYIPEEKTIYITPIEKYKSWMKYTLSLAGQLKTPTGKVLQNKVVYSFDMLQNNFESQINNKFMEFVPNAVAEDDEDYYNEIKYALQNYQTHLKLILKNCNRYNYSTDVFEMVSDICLNVPLINYGFKAVKTSVYPVNNNQRELDINFEYYFPAEKMKSMSIEANVKAKSILASLITPNMSDWQKELAIHDFIVLNTRYDKNKQEDLPYEDYTDFGVFILGRAVCDGYAKAMYRLMNLSGVPCVYVTGEADGQPHAWNIVRLSDGFYQVDSTWDDTASIDGQTMLVHRFFNISDSQIKKTHQWKEPLFPICNGSLFTSEKINAKDNLGNNVVVINVRQFKDFYNAIRDAILKKKNKIVMNIKDYNSTVYDVEKTVKKVVSETPGASFAGNLSYTSPQELEVHEDEYVEILFTRK